MSINDNLSTKVARREANSRNIKDEQLPVYIQPTTVDLAGCDRLRYQGYVKYPACNSE